MENVGLQIGLMNSLGRLLGDSPLISLLLYSVLPSLLAYLPKMSVLPELLLRLFARGDPSYCVRTIVYKTGDNMNVSFGAGSNDMEETSTHRNNILQKAIRLYINRHKCNLDIKDAELYMLQSPTSFTAENYRRRTRKVGDMDASIKKLMGYQIAKGPKTNRWLSVDQDRQIEFRQLVDESSGSQVIKGKGCGKGMDEPTTIGPQTTITFQLRCCGSDAQKTLDDFAEEALDYYKNLRSSSIDASRYFFMPRNAPGPSDDDCFLGGKGYGKGSSPSRTHKRYVLSEHKTFGSLFFPEKMDVLKLLDDFLNSQGKFALSGFPNKLGLLLHGPPGTGKTSLIKCIAQYTKRHIVEVPLAKVKTNQELFDSMFDLVFAVPGEDEAIQMDFKDIVFVLEDVDAVSDVVQSRSHFTPMLTEQSVDLPSKGKGKGEGSGENMLWGAGKGKEKTCGATAFQTKDEELPADSDCGGKAAEKKPIPDALNLAGLLNVLDGVVDSPGRIVIMSTNHPEKLDPALIRPGRVNFAVELGYMKHEALVDIMQHIMQEELSPAQRLIASDIAEKQCVTAAMVEQSCAESNSIDTLLERLCTLAGVSTHVGLSNQGPLSHDIIPCKSHPSLCSTSSCGSSTCSRCSQPEG
jgi:chaperone BCS1